ncbi:peptidoglycan DD-metalloendopeptidase family protein [Ornithinimicrobium cryptoxanthini]|uniref:Peptidoglycan DD-metalloendopeptidase family protein n=1 Tax=Ornithinimicrobium cryptoxanthini TaxID=2934161 RepID=A0ABY4YMN1_9MICO|nr:peptidoglycan DD-metalloendopeptidase family protein [Ornithinimicrobium cryptoxanthini]USQ77796.1 peptidoglycan DD-metalloendopeptidase family protein [Ornithinimicrobium cryptoxanthini]
MKVLVGALLVLGLFLGLPVSAAVIVASVATPAVAEEHRTLACEGVLPATGQWRPPFESAYTQTSQFGNRFHPIHKEWRLHAGTDLVSQPPGGQVVAASGGTVSAVGWSGGGGNTVTIDHGGGVVTRYLHLAAPSPLSTGQVVHTGQRVGIEGSTGDSTGSHLHFEVHQGGQPLDPVPFMLEHGAPLSGAAVGPSTPPVEELPGPGLPEDGEGGIGFELPEPGQPRRDSLTNPPRQVPPAVQALYAEAGQKYAIPWTLLAGIGMEETAHGANTATSSAGARGPMQFMPATFATYGVDGDGDGLAQIDNDADSIHSAANYLIASGVNNGEQGVRGALFAYNHAHWYVNDVLFYAHAYGGGLVLGDPLHCPGGPGNPDLPPVSDERVATMLEFAAAQNGDAYILGTNGPDAWDCSSLTQTAMAAIGITAPRTAQAQRDWLATGNGFRVPVQDAQPGDLFFFDSYLGPLTIGHVGFVWDPTTLASIEAANPTKGVGHFSYEHALDNNIFEIWRLGNINDNPKPN